MTRKLLVIDDEEDIREVATLTLELKEGWEVAAAGSGADGIVLARNEKPDAILLDVMMPDLDGPSTLRLLRSLPDTKSVPIIFLTAKVQAADRRRYFDMGVNGVIAKPFDPLTLGRTICECLHWSLPACESA
jgi:CheY-like chemotaxis protein